MTHWLRGFIAIAAVLMFMGVFFALMGWTIPGENRDVIMVLIGALIARSEKIDSFLFGSSHGSERKTDLMNTRPDGTPNDPVHVEKE